MPLPEIQGNYPDVGNILKTAENIKTSRQIRSASGTRQDLNQAQLDEFTATSDDRVSDRELTKTLKELQIGREEADLLVRTTEAMTNELVTLSPEGYEGFLNKWKDKVDTSGFPPVEEILNNPDSLRMFQRQAVRTAEVIATEMKEKIRQEGATQRAKDAGEEATNRALAVEQIRQDGTTLRQALKDSGSGIKPTGDLANFIVINGRKPENAKEFGDFRRQISVSDKGLSDELKELKRSYFSTIGRANSALMGVGQFVADPNKEEVAKKEFERAENLKAAFIKAGGDPSMLGEITEADKPKPRIETVEKNDVIHNPDTKESRQWDGKKWVTIQ